MLWLKIAEFELNNHLKLKKQQIKYQLYGLWFNLQTVQVEDVDLESAIEIAELVRSCWRYMKYVHVSMNK
jgi:hypothetical protein